MLALLVLAKYYVKFTKSSKSDASWQIQLAGALLHGMHGSKFSGHACYPGHEGGRGNKLMKVGTIWFIDWLMVRVMCHG